LPSKSGTSDPRNATTTSLPSLRADEALGVGLEVLPEDRFGVANDLVVEPRGFQRARNAGLDFVGRRQRLCVLPLRRMRQPQELDRQRQIHGENSFT
jgi:hypothetical protein